MAGLTLDEILTQKAVGDRVVARGWVRSRRDSKAVTFLALADGSSMKTLQVVIDEKTANLAALEGVGTGASVAVEGELVASLGKGQAVELKATSIEVYGLADPETYPLQKKGHSMEYDFFGKPAMLTVSGQLNAESLAYGLGRVYTFGPTFRAENSNTNRHLAEFWMIEPEAAFFDIHDDMDLAEGYLKHLITSVFEERSDDLEFLNSFVDKELIKTLELTRDKTFIRLTYTEAVEILLKSGKQFEFPVSWGSDLQSEHERFLTEEHFGQPVILTGYPKEIKAFYMFQNDDAKTVAAMDVLVPRIGEIIGGSQREHRLDRLTSRLTELGMHLEDYTWYLDLHRFGAVPHAGFGLGFERAVMFCTGMVNIRDVVPFPRAVGQAAF